MVERTARLERARTEYERQKEQVEKTEDFIRRNIAGQKTKQAQSRRKMLERLDRLERPEDHWELAGKISLSFSTGGELGAKEIIRAPDLTVGYPGRTILSDVTVNIYRGDRVGIVGPNGCGKSTLLKTLVGELPPLAGQVLRGSGVRLGYYDQKLGSLTNPAACWRRSARCGPIFRPRRSDSTWPSSASSATIPSGWWAACRAESAAGCRWPR